MRADGNIRARLLWLTRPHLLFYALPWLMILLTIGTIAQAEIGLYEAHRKFFGSVIFWLGPVPLPGGYLTIGVVFISLAAKFFLASPWRMEKAGINIAHLGVLLLLLGGLLTAITQREGYILIPEGKSVSTVFAYTEGEMVTGKDTPVLMTLPFSIHLEDFRRDMHPGTHMPRGFESDIVVEDSGTKWPALIRMNEPLRYKGYTFFQSSFSQNESGETTVLSVVQNKGRIFPYVASIVIFAGLLLHLILRLRRKA